MWAGKLLRVQDLLFALSISLVCSGIRRQCPLQDKRQCGPWRAGASPGFKKRLRANAPIAGS